MNKSPKLLKNRGTEKTGINSQGKASIVHSDPVGGSPVARFWRVIRWGRHRRYFARFC